MTEIVLGVVLILVLATAIREARSLNHNRMFCRNCSNYVSGKCMKYNIEPEKDDICVEGYQE